MTRIVIIDDDDMVLDIVSDCLPKAGHMVSVVDTGDEAVLSIADAVLDAIILDCGLPGRSGLSILNELRRHVRLGSIPVMMLTGRRSAWHRRAAIKLGVADYMSKPFDHREIVNRVETMLQSVPTPGGVEVSR